PIEHARMENRTVIQWDKNDAAWMGLVKFDLLGLGILAALQHCFDLIREATGEHWELATIPKEEPAVYDMLCRADSIGVFQVESRAQMGLLPRLQPRRFYDLVIQIALVRPGPIQGGAVHPFVRRKLGQEPVSYLHPKLVAPLERTLGVPVFQEQLMQMAMAVGGCTGEDADLLRRAMGSKRGVERIESLREKLYAGMARNGLVGDAADAIYEKIQAFANFGFAESHSLSFALLVYASSWLKLHYPAAFLAGLLRAQPMGFYSPSTLVSDARRHGVEVRRPDIQLSGAEALLEGLRGMPRGEDLLDGLRGMPRGEDLRDGLRGMPPAEASRDDLRPSPARPVPASAGGIPLRPRVPEVNHPAPEADHPVPGVGHPLPDLGYPAPEPVEGPTGMDACLDPHQPPVGDFDPDAPDESAAHRRDGAFAVRLGLAAVKGVGEAAAQRIVAAREADGPFRDMRDLVRRTDVTQTQLESLATAGAFECFGLTRREAIWLAGSAAQDRSVYLPDSMIAVQPPLFTDPSSYERLAADLWATGVSTDDHPMTHYRSGLDAR